MTSETGVPDFPALVELANRLKGKDRKTCELALYTLKKQDERLANRDVRIAELENEINHLEQNFTEWLKDYRVKNDRIAELEAFRRDAFKEVAELARECGSLKAQLPHPK